MNPRFISVLVDTFNYGHFIDQAIESVLVQDFPAGRREIIVVDDGSTDDTAQRLERYGDQITLCSQSEWRAGLGVQLWLSGGSR